MSFDNHVAKKRPVVEPADPAELPTTQKERRVTHDAPTEMVDARGMAHLEAAYTDEGATEPTTDRLPGRAEDLKRVETQHQITEKAQALNYAIDARMQQLAQERKNATLWWKILDKMFRRAGEQQQRLQDIQNEIAEIGSTLHHPAVHEKTLARIAELEKELYAAHNVPEVLAAPLAEYEGAPIVHASFVGKMKPTHSKDRITNGKLGKFGQDGVRVNEVSGTSVVFDGVGSLEDSYLVGEKVAEKAEEILHGLPDTKNVDLIESYIASRYPEITAEMARFPETVQGAAVFIAKRFLPKSELLVVIKVGDGEIVVERPDGFVNELLYIPDAENDLSPEWGAKKKRETFGIGAMDKSPRYLNGELQQNVQRKILSTDYHVIVTPAHKGDKVRTTTDGFYNNTDMHLIEAIKKGQFEQLLSNLTSEKDDVVILTEEL